MARWIHRSLWCIALGFATAWLVAWGITIAMWAGWYQSPPEWRGEGIGVVEPWLLEMEMDRRPGYEGESWNGDRLDRESRISEHHRRRADRVLEIGGAAHAEENEIPFDEGASYWIQELAKATNRDPGSLTEQYHEMMARTHRIDDQIASFPPPHLADRMVSIQADSFFIYAQRVGWPIPMLQSMGGYEHTFAASGLQKTDVDEGQIKIDALKRAPLVGWQPVALSLPIGVIPLATLTNTTLFAISWFALITGLELLRSLRRRLAGRCTRCGYDLREASSKTCPECGRTKR